jgi:hypothetical protein
MKITRRQLRQIIKEEITELGESSQGDVQNTAEMLVAILEKAQVTDMTPEQKDGVLVEVDWLIANLPVFREELTQGNQ